MNHPVTTTEVHYLTERPIPTPTVIQRPNYTCITMGDLKLFFYFPDDAKEFVMELANNYENRSIIPPIGAPPAST